MIADGCCGAAQADIAAEEMLVALDDDRALIGDRRADAIGADARLAPHRSRPEPDAAKIGVVADCTAPFQCHAVIVGEEQAAPGLANRGEQAVELDAGFRQQFTRTLAHGVELTVEQPKRRARFLRSKLVQCHAAAPGGGHGRARRCRRLVRDPIDKFRMIPDDRHRPPP